jgi:hypothetical protein
VLAFLGLARAALVNDLVEAAFASPVQMSSVLWDAGDANTASPAQCCADRSNQQGSPMTQLRPHCGTPSQFHVADAAAYTSFAHSYPLDCPIDVSTTGGGR